MLEGFYVISGLPGQDLTKACLIAQHGSFESEADAIEVARLVVDSDGRAWSAVMQWTNGRERRAHFFGHWHPDAVLLPTEGPAMKAARLILKGLTALVALAGLGCPAQAKPLTAAPVVKWCQDRARALTLAKGDQPLTEEVTEQAAEALEMLKGKEFEDTGTVAGTETAFGSGDVVRKVGKGVEITLRIRGASFKCRGPFDLAAATVKPGQRLHVAGVFGGVVEAKPGTIPQGKTFLVNGGRTTVPVGGGGGTPGAWLVEGCTFKPVK